MSPTQKLIVKGVAFVAIALGVDRALSYGFQIAHERSAAMGGPGPASEGLVHAVRSAAADIVVLGHSRARHNYDPAILSEELGQSVFNAGANGQGLWYVRGMTDLVLRSYTPKTLIIDVDPQALIFNQREHDAVAFLAPFIDDSPVVRELVLDQSRLEPLKYLSRSFRFNSRAVQMANTAFRGDPDGRGFEPLDHRFDPENDKDAAELYGDDAVSIDPEPERLLADTLAQAVSAGVEVVVTTSPIYREDGLLDPRFGPMLERVSAIAAAAGVPHVVVTLETEPRFHDPSLFADATHLNADAVPGFSRLIAGRIRASREAAGRSGGGG